LELRFDNLGVEAVENDFLGINTYHCPLNISDLCYMDFMKRPFPFSEPRVSIFSEMKVRGIF
jgi:hypothetical protein